MIMFSGTGASYSESATEAPVLKWGSLVPNMQLSEPI
jgi:hypothetical protein